MRKYILIMLAVLLAIGVATSLAKGNAANAERQRIIQQCENDPNCTYVYIPQK